MNNYSVKISKRAEQDRLKLKQAGLSESAKKLIEILSQNPFQNPPPYEKLVGNLKGFYSRRINLKHRLVYTIHENEKIVAVRSMWTHYE